MEQFTDENKSLTLDLKQSNSSTSYSFRNNNSNTLFLKNKYLKLAKKHICININKLKLSRPSSPETIRLKKEKYNQLKLSRAFSQSSESSDGVRVKTKRRNWNSIRKSAIKKDEIREGSFTKLNHEDKYSEIKPSINKRQRCTDLNFRSTTVEQENPVPISNNNSCIEHNDINMKRKRKTRLSLNSPEHKTQESTRKKTKSLSSSLEDIPTSLDNSSSEKSNDCEFQNVFQIMMDTRNNLIKSPKSKVEKPKKKKKNLNVSSDSIDNCTLKNEYSFSSNSSKQLEKENDKDPLESNKSPLQQNKMLQYFTKVSIKNEVKQDSNATNNAEKSTAIAIQETETTKNISNDSEKVLNGNDKKPRKSKKDKHSSLDKCQSEVLKLKTDNSIYANKDDSKSVDKNQTLNGVELVNNKLTAKHALVNKQNIDGNDSKISNKKKNKLIKTSKCIQNLNGVEKDDNKSSLFRRKTDIVNKTIENGLSDDSNDSDIVFKRKKTQIFDSDSESSQDVNISIVNKTNQSTIDSSLVKILHKHSCLNSETENSIESANKDLEEDKSSENAENEVKLGTSGKEPTQPNEKENSEQKTDLSLKEQIVFDELTKTSFEENLDATSPINSKKKVRFSETVMEKLISPVKKTDSKSSNAFKLLMNHKEKNNKDSEKIDDKALNKKSAPKIATKKNDLDDDSEIKVVECRTGSVNSLNKALSKKSAPKIVTKKKDLDDDSEKKVMECLTGSANSLKALNKKGASKIATKKNDLDDDSEIKVVECLTGSSNSLKAFNKKSASKIATKKNCLDDSEKKVVECLTGNSNSPKALNKKSAPKISTKKNDLDHDSEKNVVECLTGSANSFDAVDVKEAETESIDLLPKVQQKDLFTYFGLANANNLGIAIEKSGRTRREAKEKRHLLKLIKTDDVDVAQLTKDSERAKLKKKKVKELKKQKPANGVCESEKGDNVTIEENLTIEKDKAVLDSSMDDFQQSSLPSVLAAVTPLKSKKKHKHKRRKLNEDSSGTASAETSAAVIVTPRTRWKMKVRLALEENNSQGSNESTGEALNEEKVEECTVVDETSIGRKTQNRSEATDVSSSVDPKTNSADVSTKKSCVVKLAPLFIKAAAKSSKSKKMSAKEVEAKQSFLHSGVPASIKKKMKVEHRLKEVEFDVFPTVSHVQQKSSSADDDDDLVNFWNLQLAPLNLLPKLQTLDTVQFLSEKLSSLFQRTHNEALTKRLYKYAPLQTVENYKTKLAELKLASPKYPIYKYFRVLSEQTRSNYIVTKNVPKEEVAQEKPTVEISLKRKRGRPKKKVAAILDESIEIVEVSDSQVVDSHTNLATTLNNSTWTEKYKPSNMDGILGNKCSVTELSEWLKYWVRNNEEHKAKKVKKRRRMDDSEESTDSDFDSSDRKPSSKGNTVILVGPNGSGKTAAVYALCSELGVNVLELNASSKRTGKKLLQDMQEATQSHQVRKTDALANFVQQNSHAAAAPAKKQDKSADKKMCLLLVEDIDIVFENRDEGFISALTTLLTNSKRPIVLVTSDAKCPHVVKFTNVHTVIKFRKPTPTNLAVWLQIVCLLEGLNVDKDFLVELTEFYKADIRRCLLHLEFWTRSGGDPVTDLDVSSQSQSSQSIATPDQWFKSPLFDVDECDDDESSNMEWRSPEDMYPGSDVKEVSKKSKVHCTCTDNLVVLSGKNNIPYPVDLGLYWWNIPKIIKFNAPNEEIENAVKNERALQRLKRFGNFVDCLGYADNVYRALKIDSGLEPIPNIWQLPLRDGVEQEENKRDYNSSVSMAEEWTHDLLDGCFSEMNCNEKVYIGMPTYLEKKSRVEYHNVCINLANAVPLSHLLSRKAVSMDYLSTLRTIHRSENQRSEHTTKRRSRFYHYLRPFNIEMNETSSEIINKTFQF